MARKSRKIAQEQLPKPLFTEVAAYIRLSAEDNNNRGSSIANQNIIINEYIDKNPELSLYKTYVDNGYTGTMFKRKAFEEMLNDIEAKRINCVIVKDLSRLGRNMIDCGYYIEYYFKERNIRFIAITDNFDTSKEQNSGILLPLKNLCNEAYVLDISRKMANHAQQSMKNGKYMSKDAPYGYFKDKNDCHKLVIDPMTAPIVRQMFDWANEKQGLSTITRNLNELGIPSPNLYKRQIGILKNDKQVGSGKWCVNAVRKILNNRTYTGNLVQGKTRMINHKRVNMDKSDYIIVENTHEAIIPEELFDMVVNRLDKQKEEYLKRGKNSYNKNIFKGKIFCSDCKRPLERHKSYDSVGTGYYFFYCGTNTGIAHGICKGCYIRENDAKKVVLRTLGKNLDLTLKDMLPFTATGKKYQQDMSKLKSKVKLLNRRLCNNQRYMQGLYESLMQNLLTKDEYFSLRNDYQIKNDELLKEEQIVKDKILKLENKRKKYEHLKESETILKRNKELTVELIAKLITKIEVNHNKEIFITFSFNDELEKVVS